ncbi:hypothetical protein COJ77_20930 [Bacillus cereus]|nr:hypothetical protein COJ77_20930 [Bacillus cereus]
MWARMLGWFYDFFLNKKKKMIEPTPKIGVFQHAIKASVTDFWVWFFVFLEVSNYEKSTNRRKNLSNF